METGAVSEKIGRGKQTTRHTQLIHIEGHSYIMDTPGFSAFDTEQMDLIYKERLQDYFVDFRPYLGRCRFQDCAHIKEKGCAVLDAVKEGKISPSRHQSYVRLYEQAKEIPDWERK